LVSEICGPDSKRGQGQLYLWFDAVGKAQTLTTRLSNGYQAISLPATGLFILVLEAGNFNRCLHAGNVEFSTQSEVSMSMRVTICIYLFGYFPMHHAQFQYADSKREIQMKTLNNFYLIIYWIQKV